MKSLPGKTAALFLLLLMLPVYAAADEKPDIYVQMGHTDSVSSVAWSPDGRYAATGSHDSTVKIWEAATGREVRTFRESSHVNAVAWSPDGKLILEGNADHLLVLRDVAAGTEVRRFQGHTGAVNAVAWSPDGRFALSGSEDKTLKLWDIATGKEVRTLKGHGGFFTERGEVLTVAWSPDGRYILSGSSDKTVKLWETNTGSEVRTFSRHKDVVRSVAFSPDGRHVVSAGDDDILRLWETATGREVKSFQAHEGLQKWGVRSVAWSPDGTQVLYTSTIEHVMTLLDVSTGKAVRKFDGHTSWINSAALSPDGKWVLSGSYDCKAKLWDAATGQELKTLQGRSHGISAIAFSPDGSQVLSSNWWESEAKLWDTATGKQIKTFKSQSPQINALAVSPDGQWVLSGNEDGTLNLWEAQTGKAVRTFSGHTKPVNSVAFSRDGGLALSGGDDTAVKLWDVATGKEIKSFAGHPNLVMSVAFSPDGRYAVSASRIDNSLILWDIATGKRVPDFRIPTFDGHTGWINSVAFSPDGKSVLIGRWMNPMEVSILEVPSGKEIASFEGRSGYTNAVAVSPDGKYGLSGGRDNLVRLFDMAGRKALKTFPGHTGAIESLAFSPDGKYAISGDATGSMIRWNVASGEMISMTVGFSDGEWIVMTPEGYFDASPKGAQYLNVRTGGQIYAIDNFYEKFFNPLYVASVLQGRKVEAPSDIRAKIMTPPEVRITSPAANETIGSDAISVTVSAKDTGGGIDGIRLYHNGKAVGEDARAVKIAAKGAEATKTYAITLIDGINTLRAVGFSTDRTESNPYELTVLLRAPQKEISLNVLAVGINKYRNPALNLNYAVPDAKGITAFFREKGPGLFKKVHIADIDDDKATKENITAQLKGLENTNPQDVVLIYLAGHGENIADKWYFIPYELVYPEREEEVKSKGISSDEIAGLIRGIKAQKVLVMIDSCKAGAMLIAMRGFEDRKALSQLSRSTGVHVIAASTKDQYAAEVKELGHGVFTYTLLEGLKGQASAGDKTVTVRRLMTHVENRLPDITMKYRKEAQYPVIDSRGMDFPLVMVQ